jgi:K+-transporting ATPase ATPase A chain
MRGSETGAGIRRDDRLFPRRILLLYALQRLQNFLTEPAWLRRGRTRPRLQHLNELYHQHQLAELGETTTSHLAQMLGLTVQNFLSAATGLAMAFALGRAFARSSASMIGNFWVDMTRVMLYILLPVSFSSRSTCRRPSPARSTQQHSRAPSRRISPLASQEFIKELGANGGGFNANSAHPFENPNAWTNLLEIWALMLVPTASE